MNEPMGTAAIRAARKSESRIAPEGRRMILIVAAIWVAMALVRAFGVVQA